MGTSFNEMMTRLSPERQARIKTVADRLEAEYLACECGGRLDVDGSCGPCEVVAEAGGVVAS